MEQDHLIQSQPVDKLSNINKNFYKLRRAGIGKNYIATYVFSFTRKQEFYVNMIILDYRKV
jgi:hypothetical protein